MPLMDTRAAGGSGPDPAEPDREPRWMRSGARCWPRGSMRCARGSGGAGPRAATRRPNRWAGRLCRRRGARGRGRPGLGLGTVRGRAQVRLAMETADLAAVAVASDDADHPPPPKNPGAAVAGTMARSRGARDEPGAGFPPVVRRRGRRGRLLKCRKLQRACDYALFRAATLMADEACSTGFSCPRTCAAPGSRRGLRRPAVALPAARAAPERPPHVCIAGNPMGVPVYLSFPGSDSSVQGDRPVRP